MTTSYPTTVTDNTGRMWFWSDDWGGYRSEGMTTHGYDTIRSQWGIREISRPPFLHYNLHPHLGDKG